MEQMSIHFQPDESVLKNSIEKRIKKEISVVITDNSTSMISFRKGKAGLKLRLNRMFVSAGDDVLDEIAGFITNKCKTTPATRDFIKQNRHSIKEKAPNRVSIVTKGRHHDLLDMFDRVNKEYFDGRVNAVITWGAKRYGLYAAKRTLGSYSADNNMIRINPMLDRAGVPRYFLEYIVYHEMLHSDIGIKVVNGRRSAHGKEFKRRERLFKHYDRAMVWERKSQ